MSTLEGGIFSRPRGKTGGIVFGAARTRSGKLVTSRLLVSPSNPNTSAQQVQRGIFSSSQDIVRQLGSGIYQVDFNRSVGQLPGFQSMQSIFMTQMASDLDLTLVNEINLGTLPQVGDFAAVAGTSGQITYTFTAGQAAPATADDLVQPLFIATTAANRALPGGIIVGDTPVRGDAEGSMSGLVPGAEYQIYYYIIGQTTALGLLSVCKIDSSLAGA